MQHEPPATFPLDIHARQEAGELRLANPLCRYAVDDCGGAIGQLDRPRLLDSMARPRLLVVD